MHGGEDEKRILILGGTTEAMALATALAGRPEFPAILSLAGRTQKPVLPSIPHRSGGFGGVDGLVSYLERTNTPLVIDATHPFAERMSWNAAAACARLGVPRLTFTRPPWSPVAGDRWTRVPDNDAAVMATGDTPKTVLLTVGRLSLAAFRRAPQHFYIARSIDWPNPDEVPPRCRVLIARPPFSIQGERALMVDEGVELVCTKNSGGIATEAKLAAARELGLPVIMVERPPAPEGDIALALYAVLDWIATHHRPAP